jgi:Phosphate transport regulator (distant homolog of PhoU)
VLLVQDGKDTAARIRRIKDIEHEGDTITHQIYEHLNVTFITPLEPQEISHLASTLDDILDYIDGSARKMGYYGVTESDAHMRELGRLIQLSVIELQEAVTRIRKITDPPAIEARCIEVNRLENLADDVLAHAITELFHTEDPVHILKFKDIYDWMELATDKCEDAANVLSDVAIRHA